MEFEIEKRRITAYFVLAFLLGSIFAEITADPISDWLFFRRTASGEPLTPFESVFYWYYLPALVYAVLFVFAYFLIKKGIVTPRVYVYIILFLAGIGTMKSMEDFGYNPQVSILLLIPFALLVFILLFRVRRED
jgi:hypothetical protein